MSRKLFVTGASGQLGSKVLGHLLDTLKVEANEIIASARHPEALAVWQARGVEIRTADFDEPRSLAQAFKGATRLLLISTVSLDKRLQQHINAVTAAEVAGIEHLVYTSISNNGDTSLAIAADHIRTERAIATSQLPGWTVLRNNWYMENLLWTIPEVLQNNGQWLSAEGDGKAAYISRDDLGLAAAAALAGSSTSKLTLDLGGMHAFSTPELAALISETISKPITVTAVTEGEVLNKALTTGLPETVAQWTSSAHSLVLNGCLSQVNDNFKKLTGTEPMSMSSWLQINKKALLGQEEKHPPTVEN